MLVGFRPAEKQHPSQAIKQSYLIQLDAFVSTCQELEVVVNTENAAKARASLLQARNTYKDIEWLFEYIDQQGARDFINGAPLPKLERKVPEMIVLDPKGLQVLDEAIFTDEQDWKSIQKLSSLLNKKADEFRSIHKLYPLNDRHVFEAMRAELIRIMSLGITGFDTPLSGNALPETSHSLQSIYDAWKNYQVQTNELNSDLSANIESAFQSGFNQLENEADFDTFNRLAFITNTIQPLYDLLLQNQFGLGIESYYEVEKQGNPINFSSQTIFSDDFLNPYYFTGLQAGQHTNELTEIGKTLFFDPVLSRNNQRSCASCHDPKKGFTDGKAKSIAIDFNGTVDRNSPTVLNAIYADRFFHDLRASNLDLQTEHVFFSPKEFDTDLMTIIHKLNQSKEYQKLFASTFNKEASSFTINKRHINLAFAAYILSLRSFNSPVDQYIRGEKISLSTSVKNGFNLFMGKAACGTCHFAPTFSGLVPPHFDENESEVLGVAINPYDTPSVVDPDAGRIASGTIKEEANFYKHSFKTPTIRNIELTAPYMHNGAYNELEDVMNFYNVGGGAGIGIHLDNQTLPTDSLGLNDAEIQDIIAFMNALTDTTGLTLVPQQLPVFEDAKLNNRKIGGEY
jgi:cytochrome c peroxidase